MTSQPSRTGSTATEPRTERDQYAQEALASCLIDVGALSSIGGPLSITWGEKMQAALRRRGYDVLPLPDSPKGKIVVLPPDPLKDAAALLERWLYSGSMTRPDIDALQQSTKEWIRERATGAPSVTEPETPALTVTPAEIRDIDMALRYALIDHDMGCRAIGMTGNCTCPARGHFDRARATVKRIGAPYRKPSGDYNLGGES